MAVVIAVLLKERVTLAQNLFVVAGAIDNDAPLLFDHRLSECPLGALGEFCRPDKGDAVFMRGGFDDIVVDEHSIDRWYRHRAFAGA